jgi:hypothetical protein
MKGDYVNEIIRLYPTQQQAAKIRRSGHKKAAA